ncbi:urease subunit beta [Herbaspirillum hiltneri N3]|uniref:Urease subunit beta n=1 Tax=Herbaspirillum hiltneri N3 TaxID=1262470 RepID=A0ABN4I1A0_9BURK|nr:urease subunit beta [Herbaspirillum hiltneri]AKZ62701.1 urease subunit beta [Herbaspirillum hiltneri N3]
MIPGEVITRLGDIELNADRPIVTIQVTNTGDRPVQVGSHCHFFEANPGLAFDRGQAMGRRLDIASGLSVRFDPGLTYEVKLVAFASNRA